MMEVQEKIIHLFTITLFWSIVFVNGMLHHPPRFQPQLDQLNLEKYVNDDYLFKMHINCLFYDGPCDPGQSKFFVFGAIETFYLCM